MAFVTTEARYSCPDGDTGKSSCRNCRSLEEAIVQAYAQSTRMRGRADATISVLLLSTDDDKIGLGECTSSRETLEKPRSSLGIAPARRIPGVPFSRVVIWLGNRKLHTSPERFARRATWIDP